MERVWKRVALHSGKKQSIETENSSVQAQNEKPKTTCCRVSSKNTLRSQKSTTQRHDKLRDFLWCDLVNADEWQTIPADDSAGEDQQDTKVTTRRRTRRSKGFSFHLDTHIMEFNPRAFTRRLCKGSKKQDNELYRSNSFKFERFERPDDTATLQKQVNYYSIRMRT